MVDGWMECRVCVETMPILSGLGRKKYSGRLPPSLLQPTGLILRVRSEWEGKEGHRKVFSLVIRRRASRVGWEERAWYYCIYGWECSADQYTSSHHVRRS